MLQIRTAEAADLGRVLEIYAAAREFMIRTGNPNQWGHTYPLEERIRLDIREGICTLVCDGTRPCGVFALIRGGDPDYLRIDGGQWLNDEPYLAVHRVAADGSAHGVFRAAADYCKGLADNIRIDTHHDNLVMQHCIERSGFTRCGIIYVRGNSPRIAYQWTRENRT